MRRILLSLVVFFLLSAAGFVIGETTPNQAVPQGALVVASKWALDGDTPKGFTKEIKEGQPQVALENGFLRLSSSKTSFGFKREVKASIKE